MKKCRNCFWCSMYVEQLTYYHCHKKDKETYPGNTCKKWSEAHPFRMRPATGGGYAGPYNEEGRKKAKVAYDILNAPVPQSLSNWEKTILDKARRTRIDAYTNTMIVSFHNDELLIIQPGKQINLGRGESDL